MNKNRKIQIVHYIINTIITLLICVNIWNNTWLALSKSIFFILTWTLVYFLSVKLSGTRLNLKTKQDNPILLCTLFLIPFLIFLTYLLAFYPGLMSPDSFDQWNQIVTFKFTNWHPAYHTILEWIITRLYLSPFSIALFQILSFSIINTTILFCFYKLGVSKNIILIIAVLTSIYPTNGFMTIILWKDILYGLSILGLTFSLFLLTNNYDNKNIGLMFIFFTINVALLRHNGIFPALFTMLTLILLARKNKTKFIKLLNLFAISICIFIFIRMPIYKLFNVESDKKIPIIINLVHYSYAILENSEDNNKKEYEFLNSIISNEEAKIKLNHYSMDWIYFSPNVNKSIVNENKELVLLTFFNIVKNNFSLSIQEFVKMNSIIWKLKTPNDGYNHTILTKIWSYNESDETNYFLQKKYNLETNSKLPHLNNYLKELSDITHKNEYIMFFWKPAFWLIFCLFLINILIDLEKSLKPIIVFLPVIGNIISMLFLIPAQDFRYHYSLSLVPIIFLLWAIKDIAVKKPKQYENT